MSATYLAAIDQGTTGTTVMILRWREHQAPTIIGKTKVDFPQHFPQADWVEHDLNEIWDSLCQAGLRSLEEAKSRDKDFAPNHIAACGITNQRETLCLFDGKTSKPLRKAIVWQCKRSRSICETMKKEGKETLIREKTGLFCDPYFTASKLRWVLDHEPDIKSQLANKSGLVGTIDTYLLHRMTGGKVHATEASNASRTLLYDIDRGEWSPDLIKLWGLPSADCLPEVRDSASSFGVCQGVPFLPDGTPITGILGDQQAALAGQGCFSPGMAKCTYGTGAFLLLNTGDQSPRSPSGLLTTIAWQLGGKRTFALEGSSFIAGAAVQFLRDQLNFIEHSTQTYELAINQVAAPHIYFVPALSGLGAPYWDPAVKGAFLGLTRATTKRQLIRACLEGIALQVGDLVHAMNQDLKGNQLTSLRVDGGASANDLLCSVQADFLHVPVERPQILDTTALGAGLFAGYGVGLISELNPSTPWMEKDKVFAPSPSKESTETRKRIWDGWQRAIAAVRAFS